MQYGINLLLWSDTLTDDLWPVVKDLKTIGYDTIEIPVFELDLEKYRDWGNRFDDIGLMRTGVAVCGPDANPISSDATVRQKGIDANKQAIDCAKAAGCTVLCGPIHSALGSFSGKAPTDDEWAWGVDSMREVAEYAGRLDVTLTLEFLNRFECYFLNSAADLAKFLDDIDHPACRAMFDTFHAHIEEKNITKAIQTLGNRIAHVHISENDRSTPGSGAVRWDEVFASLKALHYNKAMVVEAFGFSIPRIVSATKIWRPMFENEKQLARDALDFMRSGMK